MRPRVEGFTDNEAVLEEEGLSDGTESALWGGEGERQRLSRGHLAGEAGDLGAGAVRQ